MCPTPLLLAPCLPQKDKQREVEEELAVVGADLEREQAAREAAMLTHAVYEHMLQTKEHMLEALSGVREVG
jgi:hypothetical protein